jgi:hypothetical protein
MKFSTSSALQYGINVQFACELPLISRGFCCENRESRLVG